MGKMAAVVAYCCLVLFVLSNIFALAWALTLQVGAMVVLAVVGIALWTWLKDSDGGP